MAGLVEKVEEMSAEELARTIASWAAQVDPGLNRRSLLLKLSAGLSLAAVDPALALADEHRPSAGRPRRSDADADLTGIWRSWYSYRSSGRSSDLIGEHFLVLRQDGGRLMGESFPAVNESMLRLDLLLNGPVATGTWLERTSINGYYRGSVYHGAIQLIVDPMGKSMMGRWIGVDRDFNINSDWWKLEWLEDASSKRTQRAYHHKAREHQAPTATD
jgi:hypothetical protein